MSFSAEEKRVLAVVKPPSHFSKAYISAMGRNLLPHARDGRNAAYHAALGFSAQSHKGRPYRRQPCGATTRIQNRLGCSPIFDGVFVHRCGSWFQMVVSGSGWRFLLTVSRSSCRIAISGRHASPGAVCTWPQKAATVVETFRAPQLPSGQANTRRIVLLMG